MTVPYLILKTSQSLFGKPPQALSDDEMQRVRTLALRQSDLERLVLAAPEARDVVVPAPTLASALEEIRSRYADELAFLQDLAGIGLGLAEFEQALVQELKVEGVLEKVGARADRVSDVEVELYYRYHPEQFLKPESRRVRHILITVNEQFPENSEASARARLAQVAERLAKAPGRFAEQALKHSECPSAMHGGLLGEVVPGTLYPALDRALFELEPGQLSGIVQSELGFHLLLCEAVIPPRKLALDQVRTAIRDTLEARRKALCQKTWLNQIRRTDQAVLS